MVNENNAYAAIDKGAFPGRWKRLHGLRGIPDYIVWVPPEKLKPITNRGRQFFVEVKELVSMPLFRTHSFDLHLRPAQIPFFKDWPGEKYVLVRWMDSGRWSWFSGKDRITYLKDEIPGPFKRESLR